MDLHFDPDKTLNDAFEQHYDSLYRYCLSCLDGDEEAAMDAVGNIFTTARAKAEKLSRIRDIRRWLFTVARNSVRNVQRKRQTYRRRFILFDPGSFDFSGSSAETLVPFWEKRVLEAMTCFDTYDPDPEQTDEQIAELKSRFLSGLSAEERELFTSRYDERASLDELSMRYGISKDAVRMRIARITMKLADRIKIYFDETR